MAWDSSRTVPWKRLLIEWGVVAAGIAVIFSFDSANRNAGAMLTMAIVSGVAYLGVGYVMSKFGYARKSMRQMRAEAAAREVQRTATPAAAPRSKPAPTRRTSTGPSNRPAKKRR